MILKQKEFLPTGEWQVTVEGWSINWNVCYTIFVVSKMSLSAAVRGQVLECPAPR